MKLTKREILEEVANVAGGLYIARQRMTTEGILEEVDSAVENLRGLVHEQYGDAIYIAGDPR